MHATVDEDFKMFWAEYPRHVGKKDALKAWLKIRPSSELVTKMLEAVRWQRNTPAWLKDGGTFVPYAGSWLRGERWEDEPADTRPLLSRTICLCPHTPACPTSIPRWQCAKRTEIEAAMRSGTLTPEDGQHLLKLYGVSP